MTIELCTQEIDQITENFTTTFRHLTEQQLNFKPNPTTWSIAQNIDHLIVINETYYPVIKAVRENRYQLPFIAKFNFMVNWLGKMILNSVEPLRKRKIKTFAIWEPSASNIDKNILEKFAHHQTQLKQWIIDSKDLLEIGTIISSPANKNIVYKLEMAFEIIVTHEQRHFAQAKEILDLNQFS
ncbi:MAG: DinB family protein [Bacteroidia bacterium]